MNPYLIAIAIFIIAALIIWCFITRDPHAPLDSLDEYEDMARRCAKADGVDFEPQDAHLPIKSGKKT